MSSTAGGRPPVRGTTLFPYVADLGREPERPAFARLGALRRERWSRGQVLAAAADVAAWLQASGVGAGDTVLLQGADGPRWVAAFCGCVLRGAVAVPLDATLPAAAAAALGRRVSPRAGLGQTAAPLLDGLPWRPLDDLDATSGAAPPPGHVEAGGEAGVFAGGQRQPGDLLQIVFTSGTTGRPRAVPITHRNLMAGIHPIERGFRRKRRQRLVRLLRPRLLCAVPASHLFGQVVGIHLPMLMGLAVVFPEDLRPRSLRELMRREGVAVAVAVPRIVRLVRDDLVREGCVAPQLPATEAGWLRRAWRGRRVRRALGWRFSAWISGGAPLPPDVEEFWHRLGYFVVQGYGLTETAPIIAVSNPFARRRGSVGRPIAGQEIRVGADGELWVRGDNVAGGYLDDAEASSEAFQDGWLRTGDRVERDAQGRLFVKGRVKDVIVTPDGTNVDPGMVERELEAEAAIREAACVGRPGAEGETVHAALVPASAAADLDAAVRAANERLPPDHRVRDHSRWPGAELPRTSLGKLRRVAVREALQASGWPGAGRPLAAAAARADAAAQALARLTGRDAGKLNRDVDLDRDLGLSSLDRVELLAQLEAATGRTLDEPAVAQARTLEDLRQALERPPSPPLPMPRWARRRLARWARSAGRLLLVAPVFRAFVRLRVAGREHLEGLQPPLIIVANHRSHMDTPAVLLALPRRLRPRFAVAMATEHFPAVFAARAGTVAGGVADRGRLHRWLQRFGYRLVVLLFNAYPLPRHAGFSETLAYTAELAEAGCCALIFPEGRLVRSGEPLPAFRDGPALVAVRLGLPVLPAGIEGSGAVLPPKARWPRRGAIRVCFGPPLRPDRRAAAADEERAVEELTRGLERSVRGLAERG